MPPCGELRSLCHPSKKTENHHKGRERCPQNHGLNAPFVPPLLGTRSEEDSRHLPWPLPSGRHNPPAGLLPSSVIHGKGRTPACCCRSQQHQEHHIEPQVTNPAVRNCAAAQDTRLLLGTCSSCSSCPQSPASLQQPELGQGRVTGRCQLESCECH